MNDWLTESSVSVNLSTSFRQLINNSSKYNNKPDIMYSQYTIQTVDFLILDLRRLSRESCLLSTQVPFLKKKKNHTMNS